MVPPADLAPPPWPEWALEQWVWEDESTQQSAIALVEGYRERGIPVGAVIIDSPWETGYNTFRFDPDLYPDPVSMMEAFRELDVRVMLWIVSMINTDSPNFEEARSNGYLLENGRGEDILAEWWKGTGGMLDYTNPEAVAWWHGQMDRALALGIDGWKVDGTDFTGYVAHLLGGMYGAAGRVEPEEYSAMYYGDFFSYTRERLGPDRLITARPVDSYATPIPLAFAPGHVNYAAWVGDQDPTFEGLRDALFNIFSSSGLRFESDKAYVNLGSDIAGYRGDGLRDRELFVRWAQFGAFCPVMENGGSGEHRPWMYDAETLDIYTEYSCMHHQLIPYLYSEGGEAYAEGDSLLVPSGPWRWKGDRWQYMLGRDLFVAALTEAGGAGVVTFPEGEWIDLFGGERFPGGSTIEATYPLDAYPAFVRAGAILPLAGTEGCDERAFRAPEGSLVLMTVPEPPGDTVSMLEEEGAGLAASYRLDGNRMEWEVSASEREILLVVRAPGAPPTSVYVDPWGALQRLTGRSEAAGRPSGWWMDAQTDELWIKPGSARHGLRARIRFP